MIKRTTIIAIFLLLLPPAFSVTYAPHFPALSVPGARAMGGPFVTDDDTAYCMITNPAIISGVIHAGILPRASATLSGPIATFLSASSGENVDQPLAKAITSIVSTQGRLFMSADAVLPLNFGNIIQKDKVSFGWGVFNTVYGSIKMPSLIYGDVNVGFDVTGTYAMAFKILKNELHLFSLGFSANLFVQVDAAHHGVPLDVLSFYWDIPTYLNVGLGVDFGLFYKYSNTFMLALVIDNAIVPTLSIPFTSGTILQFTPAGSMQFYLLPLNVKLGIGVDLPVEWGRKIISRWRVFVDVDNLVTQSADGSGKILSTFMYMTDLNARHPLLCLSAGMQIKVYDVIDVRVGIKEMLPSIGVGFDLNPMLLDISIYGSELSNEIGGNPQGNVSVSLSFYY